jgi:hypothetical protein
LKDHKVIIQLPELTVLHMAQSHLGVLWIVH